MQKCLRTKLSAYAKMFHRAKSFFCNFFFVQFSPLVQNCFCAKVSLCNLLPSCNLVSLFKFDTYLIKSIGALTGSKNSFNKHCNRFLIKSFVYGQQLFFRSRNVFYNFWDKVSFNKNCCTHRYWLKIFSCLIY